jgi:hypothetical protein
MSRPEIAPGSIRVGFVMDKAAQGEVSLRVLRVSPVSIIPPLLSILIYHLWDEQQARWWPQFRDVVSPHRHEQQILKIYHTQQKPKFLDKIWFVLNRLSFPQIDQEFWALTFVYRRRERHNQNRYNSYRYMRKKMFGGGGRRQEVTDVRNKTM